MPDERLRRGEQTRNNIIQAAHDLFIRQGYHGTSMRQIARDAGIALGGLYNHFESKQQVFKEVFLEYHPYRDVIPAMLDAQGETAEQVLRDGTAGVATVRSAGLKRQLDRTAAVDPELNPGGKK